MAQDQNNLIWLDMEMTGLDPDNDRIIEMAVVITDSQLNTIAESPVLVVHQSDAVLDGMDDWNKSTHGRSGLIDKVKASTLDEAAAQEQMLAFCASTCPAAPRRCAATRFARIAALWRAGCRRWKRIFTTAIWTSHAERAGQALEAGAGQGPAQAWQARGAGGYL